MSLFGTIQIANNALFAAQVGLQVAGNNISNANTPGYIRQEVVYAPATTQLVGGLPLGLGVKVDGIVQQVDRFLGERLRGAISDLENSATQEDYYLQLESILAELGDTDLSTSLTNFFSSINDILNQPEDISVRNLAVLQGETLLGDIERLASRAQRIRTDVNSDIVNSAGEINRLLDEIAKLNVQVVNTEGGSTDGSDAVGLRDQRAEALSELAGIVGIRAVEQPSGSVTVFADGDFIVFEGQARHVTVDYSSDRGHSVATIHIEDSDSPLPASSGKLAGMVTSRDEILADFIDRIHEFSRVLAFEFNKVYSSGQGLTGYQELTSQHALSDADAALDQADLLFTPVNGSFQVQVRNKETAFVETTDIIVDLNGLDNDTSLNDLAEALDSIDGLNAVVTPSRELRLTSASSDTDFSFANDTSGALAALGLNVFFVGSEPPELTVNSILKDNPGLFAASQGGVGHDSGNAELLAGFGDQSIESTGGRSLFDLYSSIVSDTTQASAVTQAVSEGFRVFQRTLEGQHLSTSGVSIDDEAVRIIALQRSYQASARLISTINELLGFLINL